MKTVNEKEISIFELADGALNELPLAALFESGGDLWQLHAIENILTFFEGSLEKTSVILA